MEFTKNSDMDLADKVYRPLLEQIHKERASLGLRDNKSYRTQVQRFVKPEVKYNIAVSHSESPLLIVKHAGNPSEDVISVSLRSAVDEMVTRDSSLSKEFQKAQMAYLTRPMGGRPSQENAQRYLETVVENLPLLCAKREFTRILPAFKVTLSHNETENGVPLMYAQMLADNMMAKDQLTLLDTALAPLNVLHRHGRFIAKDNPIEEILEDLDKEPVDIQFLRLTDEPQDDRKH
jgi:hypothetical protein